MSETDKADLEVIPVRSEPSPPDTGSWFEYSWKLQQNVPERLEDAAKFLVVMISLSLTIFSTTLTIPSNILTFAFALWLVASFFAFLVLFPRKYRFHSLSVESIKQAHSLIIRSKQRRLLVAAICYFIPFAVLLVKYILELVGVIS